MRSKNISYDPRLDHLRALAALSVLMFHARMFAANHPADPISIPWIDQGHVGVSLFMVISGFLFARIAERGEIDIWKFYQSRALRIYPLLITVLAVACFATESPAADGRTAMDFIAFLMPVPQHLPTEASQMWSVAIEVEFYLMFPILFRQISRYGTLAYVTLLAFLTFVRLAVYAEMGMVHYFAFFSIFGRLDAFLAGFIANDISKKWEAPWWAPIAAFVAFVLVLWLLFRGQQFFHVIYYPQPDFSRRSSSPLWIIWPTIEAAFGCALVATYAACRGSIPFSRQIAWLGEISYSIYAWHVIVGLAVARHSPSLTPYETGALIALATICVSALSYYVIERPFLERRVKYVKSDTAAPIATLPDRQLRGRKEVEAS